LAGQTAYFSAVQRAYTELQTAWLTPAEIFSPHYGASIANYMVHTSSSTLYNHGVGSLEPFLIYEIGGGTGTLAVDILTHLKMHHPQVYDRCRYTCIEISPSLAALQQERVSSGHGDKFSVNREDACIPAAWGNRPSSEQCFVIAMEVLDNLPHDRVWREGPSGEWYETLVATEVTEERSASVTSSRSRRFKDSKTGGSRNPRILKEGLRPVEDPFVLRCLSAWETEGQKSFRYGAATVGADFMRRVRRWIGAATGECVFLPTGALQLFNTLHEMRPNHRLIAADFDQLPETAIEGWQAPLVATTQDGKTVDHGTYLVEPGSADIFFPSDFDLLCSLYGGHAAQHMKAKLFFESWAVGGGRMTRTRNGYNPLLEDYSNTSFMVS